MAKIAAWLKVRLERARCSLPGWDEIQGATAKIRLITSRELLVTMVGEGIAIKKVEGPSVRNKKDEVKATEGLSTEGKGNMNIWMDTEEEDTEEEKEVRVSKKKKKALPKDPKNELLMRLA